MMVLTTPAEWLLTYAVHSTAALGTVWCVTTVLRISKADVREVLWKTGTLAPLVTTSLQVFLGVGWLTIASPIAEGEAVVRGPERLAQPLDASLRRFGASAPPVSETALNPATDAASGSHPSGGPQGGVPLAALLVATWSLGAGMAVSLRRMRKRSVYRMVRNRKPVTRAVLHRILSEVRTEFSVSRAVRLTCCGSLPTPVVLGPSEICVPLRAMTELSDDEWRGLIGHEMGHIRRGDPRWLDAMGWIQDVLFFQPLNRLAGRMIRKAAEEQCDALVVRLLGEGRGLASCLVRAAGWFSPTSKRVPLPAMALDRSGLDLRISRLLQPNGEDGFEPSLPLHGRWAIGAGLILTLVAIGPSVHHRAAAAAVGAGIQSKATAVTAESDTAVVAALITMLSDPNAEVRVAAAGALGRIGDAPAIAPLLTAATDGNGKVQLAALRALRKLDARVRPASLQRLMHSGLAEVRAEAVRLLGDLRDDGSVGVFRALLDDPDPYVRAAAIEALGQLRAPASLQELFELLHDDSPKVREAAADFAGELRVGPAVAALEELLSDRVEEVRGAAGDALADINTDTANLALRRARARGDLPADDPTYRKGSKKK